MHAGVLLEHSVQLDRIDLFGAEIAENVFATTARIVAVLQRSAAARRCGCDDSGRHLLAAAALDRCCGGSGGTDGFARRPGAGAYVGRGCLFLFDGWSEN